MIRVFPLALVGALAFAAPLQAAGRRGEDATQRMLDAMTGHDLCARDDAQLRRLNRSLAARPAHAQPNAAPAR